MTRPLLIRQIRLLTHLRNLESTLEMRPPRDISLQESMLNNWALTTKFPQWLRIYGGLCDFQKIFSVIMLCAPYNHQSRKVNETLKRIWKTCLQENFTPTSSLALTCCVFSDKSCNASWPQLLHRRQRLIPGVWIQKTSECKIINMEMLVSYTNL